MTLPAKPADRIEDEVAFISKSRDEIGPQD
jgi:hypothetical protein